MALILLILTLVALFVYVIYVHSSSLDFDDYTRTRNNFIADKEYLEIKPQKERTWGLLIFAMMLGIIGFWALSDALYYIVTTSIDTEIRVRSKHGVSLMKIGRYITESFLLSFICIPACLWLVYKYFQTKWTPPIFVFTSKGLLYAHIYDNEKTEITPILWEDMELVHFHLYDVRLSYWTEDDRLRTIVIPHIWIDCTLDRLKEYFVNCKADVKVELPLIY